MIREATRQAFDAESRRLAGGYGPNRNESLDDVEARLERQATVAALVDELSTWHGKIGRYENPVDWARQIVTVLASDFEIKRKATP